LAKIAVIALSSRSNGDVGVEVLERELREALRLSERISTVWVVDKVTVLDDADDLAEDKPLSPAKPWHGERKELFEAVDETET
jgi:hypothetical protein